MWLLPLFICAWLADSKSAGIYLQADAFGCEFEGGTVTTSKWGCQTRKWNFTAEGAGGTFQARQFCQDKDFNSGGKMMWWTGAPIDAPSNEFTMRTGDGNPANDVKSYVPNGYVSIYIRALQFDNFYKGVVMYAKNSSNAKVGDWIIPYEESPHFQSVTFPTQCLRTVMHLNAEDKPYVSKFTFVAPGPGAGSITIKAMLKTGPPNPTDTGDFLRMPDIVLTEGKELVASRKWTLLNSTTGSCAQYCADNKQDPCTEVGLSSNVDHLEPSPVDILYPCHGALFHDCTGNPRVEMPQRFCTYHPTTCNTGAKCDLAPDGNTPLFCYCGSPPLESASAALVPGFGALIALLSMGFLGTKSEVSWAVPALLLAAMPMANAHNWMEGTRGRAASLGASQFCSPTFPQINRNAIHLQVEKDQNFVVEWAAAHGDYTYWIVIHDDARANVSMLTRKFMDDWLRGCPTGGFANQTNKPLEKKYHRFRPNLNLRTNSVVNGQSDSGSTLTYAKVFLPDPIYNGTVWDAFSLPTAPSVPGAGRPATFFRRDDQVLGYGGTSPDNILPFNKSLFPTSMLAEYNPAYLTNDRRCTYTNASFDWIETIHRYQHHDVSGAFATALLSIQARKGAGRYQVHYKWSSYCDVMDVDVKAPTPGSVTSPYGTPTPATDLDYDIAHHCWFEKPRKVGQCYEVVTTPDQCQAICSADSNCRAFQMLPLQLDSSQGDSFGKFPDKSYIPWDLFAKGMGYCDKTQFSKAAKNGSMVCYPVYTFQDDFNSARPLWSFTDDTDHQGFYGTCYIKPRPVVFLAAKQVLVDPLDEFRFRSKCMPCDNIGQNLENPRWGPQQKFCTDCKKYPATTPIVAYKAPTWTVFAATGTFNQAAHWLSPAGTPIAFADECKVLAQRDPTCSKYVMYSDYRARRYSGKANVTMTSANVNTTNANKLLNLTNGWRYTPFALSFSYYRTCACLDATVDGPPTVDATMTALACDEVKTGQCIFRNFTIYELA